MITIFTMAYNEADAIEYMINHYRSRFPNCEIVVYDNDSTDDTAKLALNNGCKVIPFSTNNEIDDEKIRQLKNNCWKSAETDWVLVCDIDELLDINSDQLSTEDKNDVSIVCSEAYSLVNMNDDLDFHNMKYGIRDVMYDKHYLFNKNKVNEINYNHGAHKSSPVGNIKFSDKKYKLFHYKYINPEYYIKRNKYTFSRLSEINKKHGWGVQWHVSDEQIINMFSELRNKAVKVM